MLTSVEGRDFMRGMEETGVAMATQFTQVDEATAAAHPGPDDWSIKQNIAHVSDTEPGLIDEAFELAANSGATIGHPPGALWGEAQHTADGRPLAEIIAEFAAVNRATLERLAKLTDEDFLKPGTHRGYGPVTVQSTLMVVLQHRRAHILQNHSNLVSLRIRREGRVPTDAYTDSGGGGAPVLFLDAAGSKWDPVLPELSGDYRLIHYKYIALPADIEQLRQDLGFDTLWIAGTATGAIDACKYAFAFPAGVAGLVLANLPVLPFARDGGPDDFSVIAAPTLTLAGESHPHVVQLQERGRQFPNHRVQVVAGSGRNVPGEQPAATAAALRAFIPTAVRT